MEHVLTTIWSLVPALIACLFEFRVTLGILRLSGRPGQILPGYLATECCILVVILPALGSGVLALLLAEMGRSSNQAWLGLVFNPYCLAVVLSTLTCGSMWLCVVLAKPKRLYADQSAFVPVVMNAVFYLAFAVIGVAGSIGLTLEARYGLDAARGESMAYFFGSLFLAPLAVSANLVLLIVHIARTRAFHRREAAGQIPTEADDAA